jgi:hypothetical protein
MESGQRINPVHGRKPDSRIAKRKRDDVARSIASYEKKLAHALRCLSRPPSLGGSL